MQQFSLHTTNAERDILRLSREVKELEDSVKIDPEVSSLETQNSKLAYQKTHLLRALEQERAHRMISFPSYFSSKLQSVTDEAYPGLDVKIEVGPSKGKTGDYQCSSAFLLAKEITKSGTKTNPREVATKLSENFAELECLEKV